MLSQTDNDKPFKEPDVEELIVWKITHQIIPCEALQKMMVMPLLRALTEDVLALQAVIRPNSIV